MTGRRIRFGIHTGTQFFPWEEIVRIWKRAEELGYDTAWTYDHFTAVMLDPATPCLEAWTCLAALATQTRSLRIGTLVTGNTYRHPAILAKVATTVDVISGGRVEFGIGAGWYEPEHEMFGLRFGGGRERAERLDEALVVIRSLWEEAKTSFQGTHYTIHDAVAEPKPVQRPHPPITIAASGEKVMLPIVARHADAWSSFGSPDLFRRRIQMLDELARTNGRDPASIEKAVLMPAIVADDMEPFAFMLTGWAAYLGVDEQEGRNWMLAGTGDEVCRQVDAFIDAGVSHIVILVTPFNADVLERFAAEVLPRYR
ncbi:MAG: TIGR03560 family F420-dependent LLM class oxidoreductase [Actinomycetota bacterium]